MKKKIFVLFFYFKKGDYGTIFEQDQAYQI